MNVAPKHSRVEGSAATDLNDLIPSTETVGEYSMSCFSPDRLGPAILYKKAGRGGGWESATEPKGSKQRKISNTFPLRGFQK